MLIPRRTIVLAALFAVPLHAHATQAKIDADTCSSLRLEQIKFRQSGILDDLSKGADWAKANLSADRLREIEHYMQLDEQVKFGCRDAKLSPEAQRASEAAARIEINSDADPTAPVAKDPPKPGGADKSADKKPAPKKNAKKAKPSDAKAHGDKSSKSSTSDQSRNDAYVAPQVVRESESNDARTQGQAAAFADTPASSSPSLPAFGFGEMTVLPYSAP